MALVAACPAAGLARDLTVVARGKTMQDALVHADCVAVHRGHRPPGATESWGGGLDALRSQLKAPDNAWDLVEVNAEELADRLQRGPVEKLDWSAIGGKDHYLPQGVSDCGVGAALTTLVLAWDRDKLPAAPGWADFWDVAKYPGKRGLYKGVRGNLEFALIADGVSPSRRLQGAGDQRGRGPGRSASWTSSSRISCGGTPGRRPRISCVPATC